MNVNIIDAFISVLCVAVLVPQMGILACIVTIYVTEILNAALSIVRLLKITGYSPSVFALVLRPLFCIVGASCITAFGVRCLLPAAHHAIPALILHIALIATLYVLLLFCTGSFQKKDTEWLIGCFVDKTCKS